MYLVPTFLSLVGSWIPGVVIKATSSTRNLRKGTPSYEDRVNYVALRKHDVAQVGTIFGAKSNAPHFVASFIY